MVAVFLFVFVSMRFSPVWFQALVETAGHVTAEMGEVKEARASGWLGFSTVFTRCFNGFLLCFYGFSIVFLRVFFYGSLFVVFVSKLFFVLLFCVELLFLGSWEMLSDCFFYVFFIFSRFFYGVSRMSF